jgi:hypothetical protein
MKQKKIFYLLLLLLSILLFCIFYNSKEGFLDTNYEKSIYLIWRNKIENSGTNYGFGDKIRGAISIYQYCKNNKINLKIDATDDICSEFLKNVVSPDYEIIKDKELIILGHWMKLGEIDEKIKSQLETKNTVYLFSNSWPIQDLDDDDKQFAKFVCEPKENITNEINDKLKKLPEIFGIQHFRFNDIVFKNDIDTTNKLFNKYFNLLVENNKPNEVLITNSNNFKRNAKEKINIKTIDCYNEICKIQHIGDSLDKESVKNSLIEFFILSKAKYIKSHTCYDWPSNFALWPSKIYDIPFDNVYIDEKSLV